MFSSKVTNIRFDICLSSRDENENTDAILEITDTSSHRAKMTKAQVISFIFSLACWFVFQIAAEDPSKYIKPKLAKRTPKFFGREKAFAIQLFCIGEDYEKR